MSHSQPTDDSYPDEPPVDADTEPTSPWIVSPRARILVADDDPRSLETLAAEFRRQGYDVYKARSADGALALLADMHGSGSPTDDVELLVLVTGLSERSGVHLLRDLRRQHCTIPTLLIADRPAPGLCTLAACLGAVVLLRPVARERLGDVAIRMILAGPPVGSRRARASSHGRVVRSVR